MKDLAFAYCSTEEVKILPITIYLAPIHSVGNSLLKTNFRDPSHPKIPPKERRILMQISCSP